MILIGQYDSPFVRRVAVTLQLYGLSYEHRPWSAIGDADRIAAFNPLIRVPTLVSDDQVAITDSAAIIQYLDHLAGYGNFLNRNWPQQRDVLRLTGYAAGVAEKGVALLYERAFHKDATPAWHARLCRQVADTLAMLEDERSSRKSPWLCGDRLSHADIMIGTMFRFLREAQPGPFELDGLKALVQHSEACEALPEFRQAYQPFKLAGAD